MEKNISDFFLYLKIIKKNKQFLALSHSNKSGVQIFHKSVILIHFVL